MAGNRENTLVSMDVIIAAIGQNKTAGEVVRERRAKFKPKPKQITKGYPAEHGLGKSRIDGSS